MVLIFGVLWCVCVCYVVNVPYEGYCANGSGCRGYVESASVVR